jgi:Zn-dependent membrane protease YugP
MYFDSTYLIYVVPALIISLWASANVHSAFSRYSSLRISSGLTGAETARRVLEQNGVLDVKIERVEGSLSDHYDPRTKVIRLSDSVYDASSAAAAGVAAHEAGHAVQHAEGYVPLKIRREIIPVTNFGSRLSLPLILLGILFGSSSLYFLAYIGIALFSLTVLLQLVTLPVEFNASRRAVSALEMGGFTDEELRGTKKVLSAAALTYVAALITAVLQMLRLLTIVRRRR